ncbi:hypothetical protein OCA8868_01125 [Octadecabacter ascidiaceicola]|uniref:Uncharacterized protein n=1 Tax=Octadecabacter ascidiaceicola TaxID=1655543 RepID=A0A238K3Z7_9RHOB|nr:hypothetical protein OCA8868_01125 [Octadecabacter ascidiaceicola]
MASGGSGVYKVHSRDVARVAGPTAWVMGKVTGCMCEFATVVKLKSQRPANFAGFWFLWVLPFARNRMPKVKRRAG